ncbi:MAG: hypothetical protein ACJZ2F_02080 [Acidimicrobiales bacterium]
MTEIKIQRSQLPSLTQVQTTTSVTVANQTVTAVTTDDDAAGFTIVQTDGSTSVAETGTTDTFTVVLTAQPASNVVLTISSGDTGEATVTSPLTFTSANWNTASNRDRHGYK